MEATADAYSELAGVYDEMVVDPSYPYWADFCERLWRLDSRRVTSVLDVCCGTGLFAAELAQRGYRLVGVDGSAAMLARARKTLGPTVELHEALLPQLGTAQTFDAAVSTFDGLNYVPVDVFTDSLASVAERLRVGGWFIFDLHTDGLMRFTSANPVVSGSFKGRDFTLTSEVDESARTCLTTIELTDAVGTGFREQHLQFFHSDAVVRNALTRAGFTAIAVFDEYTDDPVTETSLRATWVARHA